MTGEVARRARGGKLQSRRLRISDHGSNRLWGFPPPPRMTWHLPRKTAEGSRNHRLLRGGWTRPAPAGQSALPTPTSRRPCPKGAWRCRRHLRRGSHVCGRSHGVPRNLLPESVCYRLLRCRRNTGSAYAAGDCLRWMPCFVAGPRHRRAVPPPRLGSARALEDRRRRPSLPPALRSGSGRPAVLRPASKATG